MKIRTFILSIAVSSFLPTFAQEEFIFENADCSLRMKNAFAMNSKIDGYVKEELSELQELASEELGKRKFTIHPFIEDKRVVAGELYFDWSRDFTQESIYNSCVIHIAIKKANGQVPLDNDPIIFSKTVRRRVPRITFRGMERCKLAMRECFINIPSCKKIGFYGEKK